MYRYQIGFLKAENLTGWYKYQYQIGFKKLKTYRYGTMFVRSISSKSYLLTI
jgi:hypothetical protein